MPRARVDRGISMALLAAVLFGLSAPISKRLLELAAPQLLAGLLYLGSGAGLLFVLLVRKHRSAADAPLSPRDAPWLIGAICMGGIVAPVLLMVGLTHTVASTASLMLNLEGVFTALLAWFVFRENVDRRIALGMVAIVGGSVVLSWQGNLTPSGVLGPLAIAGACLAWGIDNNLTQKVSAGDPVQIAMLKGMIAGIVNFSIALARGNSLPGGRVVGSALLLGFLSYGVSLVLFVMALRRLGTARTGAYFSTAPFIGAIASLFLFRDPLTWSLAVAGLAMMGGVWLHATEHHEHRHVHEPLEHAHLHVHDAHHLHEHSADDPPGEPHSHAHRHAPLVHAHAHYPDIHHRHSHD
ncbi:MAG: DMT family transporter [Gemmatimonadaceae bacterium]|nr:DMT family transporter [Gemmatimonadaceae bacterium]